MNERLTDDELAEFCLLVDAARKEGGPESEEGMILDEFLDSHVKQIADEMLERRRADLSAEDMEALEHARDLVKAEADICGEDECAASECVRNAAALSVLDRLLTASKETK